MSAVLSTRTLVVSRVKMKNNCVPKLIKEEKKKKLIITMYYQFVHLLTIKNETLNFVFKDLKYENLVIVLL